MSSNVKKLPEDAPQIPLIPASIHIRTEKPDAGWWKWNIEFQKRDTEITKSILGGNAVGLVVCL